MPDDISRKLPADTKAVVESFLSDEDARNLASTSKLFREAPSLFHVGTTANQEHIMPILLRLVVNGQESSVVSDEIRNGKVYKKALLRINPTYLLARGDVTDNSGRHFKNITAFEYAVWAMDSHMYNKMLDCLPKDAVGEEIQKELLAQYELVTTKGLNYTKVCTLLKMTTDPKSIPVEDLSVKHLNNNNGCIQYGEDVFYLDNESNPKTLTLVEPTKAQALRTIMRKLKINNLKMTAVDRMIEIIAKATDSKRHHVHRQKPLDFQPLQTLIDALKVYMNSFSADSTWTLQQRETYWCTVVGRAQRDVPAHVVAEYSRSDRSFEPTPGFHDETLPRVLQFRKLQDGMNNLWWPDTAHKDNKMGVDFGILRAKRSLATGLRCAGDKDCALDLEALTALCKVRTHDLVDLNQRLHDPLQKPDADPGL